MQVTIDTDIGVQVAKKEHVDTDMHVQVTEELPIDTENMCRWLLTLTYVCR